MAALSLSSRSTSPLLLPLCAVVAGYVAFKAYVPKFEARNVPKRVQLDAVQASTREMATMDPASVEALRAQVQRERAAVAAQEERIPTAIRAGTLLRQLDAAARRHGLSLGALQPADPNSGVPPAAIKPYAASSYSVKVSGTWDAIAALLADWRAAQPGALPSIRAIRANTDGRLVAEVVFTMVTRAPGVRSPGSAQDGSSQPTAGSVAVPTLPEANPREPSERMPPATTAQSGTGPSR